MGPVLSNYVKRTSEHVAGKPVGHGGLQGRSRWCRLGGTHLRKVLAFALVQGAEKSFHLEPLEVILLLLELDLWKGFQGWFLVELHSVLCFDR